MKTILSCGCAVDADAKVFAVESDHEDGVEFICANDDCIQRAADTWGWSVDDVKEEIIGTCLAGQIDEAKQNRHRCSMCWDTVMAIPGAENWNCTEVHHTPFDDCAELEYYHDKCRDMAAEGRMTCDKCHRTILDGSGHTSYFRILGECEPVCLRCYEQLLHEGLLDVAYWQGLAEGQHGEVWGMFFNDGELAAKGYTAGDDFFLKRDECIAKLGKAGLKLAEQGYVVITEYTGLALGGGEGFVKLHYKYKKGEV